MHSVTVIIPTFKPDETFESLIARLQKQTIRPEKIIVINTGEKWWDEAEIDKSPFVFGTLSGIRMELYHIPEEEFDHGGTRRKAAFLAETDMILFMTQDAVPADPFLIENLLKAMEQRENVGAAYARQLPARDCGYLERYTRSFNYGEESCLRSLKDVEKLGIKAFFCSNVCAMYRMETYRALGGFVSPTIFNEDMIFAAELLKNGGQVAYAAGAKVIHSHNYSGGQQFRRNFDLAVSQADHPEIFEEVRSEKEGIRLVKKSAGYLVKTGHFWLLPFLIWQSGCKYAGYFLGKRYQKLPRAVIMRCTSNKNYWKYHYFQNNHKLNTNC